MSTTNSLWPLLPEICLLVFACFLLLVATFKHKNHLSIHYFVAQIALVVTALVISWQLTVTPSLTLQQAFMTDPLSQIAKLVMVALGFWTFIYARDYLRDKGIASAEFYVLSLFSLLGMMILVSAQNFLILYLGLELLSLPLYALVAMQRNNARASEAAMKYFVMGALASGILLYGLSMLYGATHSLQLSHVARAIATTPINQQLILLFGLVFIVVGLAFKLGAAPFHMWVPDVYEGAPTAVTLWLSTAPKVAAFVMVIRLLVFTMPSLHEHWQLLWLVIALLSIGLGNIAAIAQDSIKRMLAYSSIAHIGYLSLGILSGSMQGQAAAFFYVISYSIMALGGFGMITLLSQRGFEAEKITDFKGLNARNPWLAFIMLLLMFSMAGIPPTMGFFAKLGVLQALVQQGMIWIAVVAVLFAVIGAFYYLRVVRVMYFEAPDDELPLQIAWDHGFAISINGLLLLLLGLFPASLMQLCIGVF